MDEFHEFWRTGTLCTTEELTKNQLRRNVGKI